MSIIETKHHLLMDSAEVVLAVRLLMAVCVIAVGFLFLLIYSQQDSFAHADFNRYLARYIGRLDSWFKPEAGFYLVGNIAGKFLTFTAYQLFLIFALLVTYFSLLISSEKSMSAFLVGALFPITFIGFDSFFSAVRGTAAGLFLFAFFRFKPALFAIYFVHIGTLFQAMLMFVFRFWTLLFLFFSASILVTIFFGEISQFVLAYIQRFTDFKGDGVLRGVYNAIFVFYFVWLRIGFETNSKLIQRLSDFLFVLYVVFAAVDLPYAYRLSYLPTLLLCLNLSHFRLPQVFYPSFFAICLVFVGLTAFRIT